MLLCSVLVDVFCCCFLGRGFFSLASGNSSGETDFRGGQGPLVRGVDTHVGKQPPGLQWLLPTPATFLFSRDVACGKSPRQSIRRSATARLPVMRDFLAPNQPTVVDFSGCRVGSPSPRAQLHRLDIFHKRLSRTPRKQNLRWTNPRMYDGSGFDTHTCRVSSLSAAFALREP